MKAIILLLCLAIAREISGSIFQRRRSDADRFNVLPGVAFEYQAGLQGRQQEHRPRNYQAYPSADDYQRQQQLSSLEQQRQLQQQQFQQYRQQHKHQEQQQYSQQQYPQQHQQRYQQQQYQRQGQEQYQHNQYPEQSRELSSQEQYSKYKQSASSEEHQRQSSYEQQEMRQRNSQEVPEYQKNGKNAQGVHHFQKQQKLNRQEQQRLGDQLIQFADRDPSQPEQQRNSQESEYLNAPGPHHFQKQQQLSRQEQERLGDKLIQYADREQQPQRFSSEEKLSGNSNHRQYAPGLYHLQKQQLLSRHEQQRLGEKLIQFADLDAAQEARLKSIQQYSESREDAPGVLHFQRQQKLSSHEQRQLGDKLIKYADRSSNEQNQYSVNKYSEQEEQSQSQQYNSEEQHNVQEVQYDRSSGDYPAPVFADRSSAFIMKSAQAGDKKLFGDIVEWREIKMASSQDQKIHKKDIQKIYRSGQKAQKHLSDKEKKQFHQELSNAYGAVNEDAYLNATQLLKKNQYPVQEHRVTTKDGYILQLFRIPPHKRAREVRPRPVVFLMHGLLGSADDFLVLGPGKALAYLLSNDGYDVWLGNARSSKYARHASKNRARPDYWQFSNDEIALYDLPAMIDYVLNTAEQPKMFYVGHSSGATAFFALAASRPAYNQKIAMMYALSPMVYMHHAPSPMLRSMAPSSRLYQRVTKQIGYGEFKPSRELVHTMGGAMCDIEIGCEHVCSNAYAVLAGFNPKNLDMERIPVMLNHVPAGASAMQMAQFSMAFDSNEFRMYDFGAEMNQKIYGASQPPKYNMKKVTAPVSLFYSEHDFLAHPKDVKQLRKELPNVTESHKVSADYFSQLDFQFSMLAPKVVYQRLLESIQNHKSY